MAQGAGGAGLGLDKAHAGEVLVLLSPPAGVGAAVVGVLVVHVFCLDNDGADIGFGLFGLLQLLSGQHVGQAVGGIALAGNGQEHGAHVLDGHGIGLCLGIVDEGTFRQRDVMTGRIGLRLGIRSLGLGRHTGDGDDIGLLRDGVVAVIVQVEVDVVGILADDTARELAVVQLQRVAGVILEGDFCRSRLLHVQIGVRGIGHQLVAVAVDIEVALRHLRILLVEVGLLLGLRTPARLVVRALDLEGNSLGGIIVKCNHNGDGTVAAR